MKRQLKKRHELRTYIDGDSLIAFMRDKINNPDHIKSNMSSRENVKWTQDPEANILLLLIDEVEARRDSETAKKLRDTVTFEVSVSIVE